MVFNVKRVVTPGIMADDAFLQQLKQFGEQRKAEMSTAPMPNSAVDFARNLQTSWFDKLNKPIRTGYTPDGPVGGEAASPMPEMPAMPQQRQTAADRAAMDEARGSDMADAWDRFGPYVAPGSYFGGKLIGALGTMSPERSAEATTQSLEELRAQEQEQITRLNDMTEAARLGERLKMSGGDTFTPPQDELTDVARDLGFTNDTQQQQQDAISERARGIASQQLQDTRSQIAERTKQPLKQEWWLNAMQVGAKSAAETGLSGLKYPLMFYEMQREAITGNPDRSDARAWLDATSAAIDKLLPGDKARSKDFMTKLSAGGGSYAAFLLTGYVGAVARLPAATAYLGAASQGVSMAQDAERMNATSYQKYMALIVGSGLGMTEAIPIDRMFARADAYYGGTLQRLLSTTSAASMQEFLQEAGQAVGEDISAKFLIGYDPDREISVKDWLEAGAVGAITGAGGALATNAMRGGNGAAEGAADPAVQQEQAVRQAIETKQLEVDNALGGERVPDIGADVGPLPAPGSTPVTAEQPAAPAADVEGDTGVAVYRGGTMPAPREDGLIELNHWSNTPLQNIDPSLRGTGPLRGAERARLVGPDAVDRSYFGVGDPEAYDRAQAEEKARRSTMTPKEKAAATREDNKRYDRYRRGEEPFPGDTAPYRPEGGLGPYRHTVTVKPEELYNWREDPMNLKAGLDRTLTPNEQSTQYEKLIKDAGFKGIYFSSSPLGQTAVMFDKRQPERVVDDRARKAYNATKLTDTDTTALPGLTGSTGPVPSVVQAARAYAKSIKLPARRQSEYVQVDKDRAKRIAQAYEEMKHDPEAPAVKAAYRAMIDETLAQYQYVKASGLKIDFIEPGMDDPYPQGPKQVLADLKNNHLWVFPTDSGFGTLTEAEKTNPLLEPTDEYVNGRRLLANDVFRIVHDFFGHGIEGSGFGARGEENAWQSHMRLYTDKALPAVTSETRGQNSWVNFGPHGEANRANQRETVYADQKTGLMPEWTWQEGVADDESFDAMLSAEMLDRLPAMHSILPYVTEAEADRITDRTAKTIADIFTSLPPAEEMAAVAYSGRAKRGWYARSARAFVDIFGTEDAPRFAALLAALSPQTSVESNAVNALKVWTAWVKAGRPTEQGRIRTLMELNVQGSGTSGSVLPAWINNSIEALTNPDPAKIELSGPKVSAFMENLRGNVNEVTNDTWMANYANMDQAIFVGRAVKSAGRSVKKAGPGYIAMSAATRRAAEVATELTGETWTPAEIQETVWSWAKTLYEKASETGDTAEQIVSMAAMTANEIANTPDFAQLFANGVYRNILEQGGYDLESITGGSDGAGSDATDGSHPSSAEGTAIDERAFDAYLRDAARRLDALRARREADEDPDDLEAIFAGSSAQTLESPSFIRAMDMTDEGVDPETIWNETGFYRGTDGKWRFEISDSDAALTEKAKRYFEEGDAAGMRADEVLQHGKLFEAYPDLRSLNIVFQKGEEGGVYNHNNRTIQATGPTEAVAISVMLHELQHAIQEIEGTSRGGNLSMGRIYEGTNVENWRKALATAEDAYTSGKISLEALEQYRAGFDRAAAYEYYRRLAGEVEARNVQSRYEDSQRLLADAKRGQRIEPRLRDLYPGLTADVDRDDQIIITRSRDGMGAQMAQAVKEPRLWPAVKSNGKVYKSVSDHLSAINQIPDARERAAARADGDNRGFVDARGRFLNRFRAQEYALENDLIRPDAPAWARTAPDLISENLRRDFDAMAAPKGTAQNRAPYKGEQTRPEAGIPVTPGATPAEVSLTQIANNVVKALDLTARQGRLSLRGSEVMGQYSRKQGVVRLRTWGDLSTLVHEGGHALHDASAGALKAFETAYADRLRKVAEDLYADTTKLNKDQMLREGFAEFFRVYTLSRQFAYKHYPDMVDEFSRVMETNAPQTKKALDAVGDQFAAWLQLPSERLIAGMVVDATQPGKVNQAVQELREAGFPTWFHEHARNATATVVNRLAPLNDVVVQMLNVGQTNSGKAVDLKRADDPRVLAQLSRNTGSRAMVQLTDGVMPYRSTQPASRGLREAILLSQGLRADQAPRRFDEKRLKDFDGYLIALRARDEYERYAKGIIKRPPINASVGDVTQAIADFEGRYGQSFRDAAEIVHEFGMALWKKQYDAGLMDVDTYRDGLTRNFYAPLQRDMSDKKASLGQSAITGGQSVVKQFRGSDRQIVSPTAVLMHKAFALEQIIAENDVKKALAVLADRVGTAGSLVERVPASTLMSKTYSVREVAKQLTNDEDISATDAADLMSILQTSMDNDNVLSFFRAEQASAKGENIVFYWENGKLAAVQVKDGDVGADIVNLLNGVGRENFNQIGVELIAGVSTAVRSAITLWPDFLLVNYVRDQFSAWVLNDVGFKPFWSGARGMLDEVKQNEWARSYNASLGIMGGMNVASLHDARVRRDISALRGKGYITKAFGESGYLGAAKGMANLVELSETGTRLGLFKGAYERAKADGLSDWEASIEAAYTATDYIDYGLNGNRMLLARRTIPFLNAQLQGLSKMMRTLGANEVRQRKGLRFALSAFFKSTNGMDLSRTEKQAVITGRKAWVKMASLGLLSAALAFAFEDDPDYQETSEYLRTTHWVIPRGDGEIITIPKPFELAILANAVERGFEMAAGDPEAKNRFMRGLAFNLAPPTTPPAIGTMIEMAANYDFFSGREIVPDYMRALEPALQYNNYTTEFAKWLGANTNMSPMMIDHFMSSLGASAYRDLSTMINQTNPNRPSLDATDVPIIRRFVRDARRGAVSAQDFWKQASTQTGTLRGAEVSYKTMLEGGNESGANRFLDTLEPDAKAYALLGAHFKAEHKRLNPIYRARQVATVISAMRRELGSDLGLGDTTRKGSADTIKLTSATKARVDEVLSEYVRREVRNTLIATETPGWAGKRNIAVEPTMDMLDKINPEVADELRRRLRKAKVYDAETVYRSWPEARDRLLRDREAAFLSDLEIQAKAFY